MDDTPGRDEIGLATVCGDLAKQQFAAIRLKPHKIGVDPSSSWTLNEPYAR